jgi:hypothetical protein
LERLPDPATVPEAQSEDLHDILNSVAKVKIKFSVEGSTTEAKQSQRNVALRKFVKWLLDYVDYLPGKVPEAFIWEHMAKDEESAQFELIQDPKKRFVELARRELGRAEFEAVSSQDILATQLRKLATIPESTSEFVALRGRLSKAAEN